MMNRVIDLCSEDSEFVEVDPIGRYGRYNEILGKRASKTVYRAFDEYEGIESVEGGKERAVAGELVEGKTGVNNDTGEIGDEKNEIADGPHEEERKEIDRTLLLCQRQGHFTCTTTNFWTMLVGNIGSVPVIASEVLDWLLQNMSSTLEHIADRASPKENGPINSSDQDIQMADVGINSLKPSSSPRGPSFIEGISKSSYVKQASDLKCTSVKAIGVEHCEHAHLIAAARRICIANCRECLFFLGVNQQPFIVGDNHKLQVAPYNTFYSQLEKHMNEVGIDPNINRWDEHVALGVVDPHDLLSHPVGVSNVQAESATQLDPDHFTDFVTPNWLEREHAGSTKDNPFPLLDAYLASQQKNIKSLGEVKQILRETQLEESRKRELSSDLHACFGEEETTQNSAYKFPFWPLTGNICFTWLLCTIMYKGKFLLH